MIGILITVLVVFVLILVQGFFSGSEIALVNSDKSKLKHDAKQGRAGSALATKMFERPEVILTTTLVGTNLALVISSVLGTTLLITLFGEIGGVLAIIVLTPLTLVFGEVIPKSVGQQESDRLTPWLIFPLYAMSLLFFPIVFVFSRIARLIAKAVGTSKPGAEMFAVREQMRAVLDAADGTSMDHPFDRLRIRNVVRFGGLVASDVMVPALEMSALSIDDDAALAIDVLRDTGGAFLPAYDGERNNVVGIAHLTVWDIVDTELHTKKVADFVNPACFVPALQPAAELLPILRSREDESAVVVDEYGSAVGLINVNMILESVVGKTAAGAPHAEHPAGSFAGYDDLGDDTYIVDARMPIADVNDLLAIKLSTAASHSIGGMLVARLRRIPKVGDVVVEEGFEFLVKDATERTATRIRVSRSSRVGAAG